MAPKRRNATEQLQHMYQQADAYNLRVDFKVICKVVKNNSHAIRAVKQCLVSLGLWDGSAPAPEPTAPSPVQTRPAQLALTAPPQLSLTDGSETGELEVVADGNEQEVTAAPDIALFNSLGLKESLHRNYNTWGSIPVAYWKYWLSMAQPISFSINNLKSLLTKGQREIPKPPLMQLAEFEFGLDLESLVGDERGVMPLSSLLKQMAQSRGSLGKNLQLPVNWKDQGYYSCAVVEGELVIQNRYSGSSAAMPDWGNTPPPEIDVNWSERRAYFKVGNGRSLKNIFCTEVVRMVDPPLVT